jgi:hypothetical protein
MLSMIFKIDFYQNYLFLIVHLNLKKIIKNVFLHLLNKITIMLNFDFNKQYFSYIFTLFIIIYKLIFYKNYLIIFFIFFKLNLEYPYICFILLILI